MFLNHFTELIKVEDLNKSGVGLGLSIAQDIIKSTWWKYFFI